jgi:hypothetical protein
MRKKRKKEQGERFDDETARRRMQHGTAQNDKDGHPAASDSARGDGLLCPVGRPRPCVTMAISSTAGMEIIHARNKISG